MVAGIQKIAILFVCSVHLSSIYYSLLIPWARPLVPVSHGWYEITVPIEVGLLKCFSPICEQYEALHHSLRASSLQSNKFDKPPIPLDMKAVPYEQRPVILGDAIPDYGGNFSPIESEKKSIERFFLPYKFASITTIVFMSVTVILSSFLLLLLGYEGATGYSPVSHNLHNILLLINTFALFLSVMCYMLITFMHLNGGLYVEGVWIISYSSILGFLSCLLINVLENAFNSDQDSGSDRYDVSVTGYYSSIAPEVELSEEDSERLLSYQSQSRPPRNDSHTNSRPARTTFQPLPPPPTRSKQTIQ